MSLAQGTRTVAKAADTTLNAVAEVVADVFETIGSAVAHGFDVVAGATARLPGVGRVVARVIRWPGAVIAGACDLLGAIVKGAVGVVSGVVGGGIRVVGGMLGRDRAVIMDGALGIASGVAGAIVVIGGKAVALLQAAIFLQAPGRRLTKEEALLLKRVFAQSVALYNVRLIEGWAGIFGLNRRAFTLGNTIYLKGRDVSREPELLVHECTHVWQYQDRGARYASDAIGAQMFIDDAYSWEKEIQRGNDEWVSFNMEAAAKFLEHLYPLGELVGGGAAPRRGGGTFYDADERTGTGRFVFNGVDHTDRANRGVAALRGARAVRLSRLFL